MKCPKCKLENPDNAIRCDCGYDFGKKKMEKSYLIESEREKLHVPYKIRFVHSLLDQIIIFLVAGCIIYLIDISINDDTGDIARSFLWFIAFAYYFSMETLFQKTISKFFTKTKIVNIDGSKANWKKIFLRTMIRFIPFDPISMSNGTFWHDRWSKTRVIKG